MAARVRLGVIFPGQGSQTTGMGGAIAERHPVAAELFARAERVLGYDLLALVKNGPDDTLRETRYSQPAIFVTNYALAAAACDALARALGDDFAVVASAGHSFAEICSLTLAGALEFDDAVALISERSLAMQAAAETAPGTMAAVLGLDEPRTRTTLEEARGAGRVQLATFNAPGQIVISGDRDAVAAAGERALAAGAKRVIPLNVSGAWHSELMVPARDRFAPYVAAVPIELPRFDVVSNVDAGVYADVATIRTNLVRSVTDAVRWHAAATRLVELRLDHVVEFGGSAVLTPLLKRLPGAPPGTFAGDDRGIDKLVETLAGVAHA